MGIYILLFADDQVLIENDADIVYVTRKLMEEYSKWCLEINTNNTHLSPYFQDFLEALLSLYHLVWPQVDEFPFITVECVICIKLEKPLDI